MEFVNHKPIDQIEATDVMAFVYQAEDYGTRNVYSCAVRDFLRAGGVDVGKIKLGRRKAKPPPRFPRRDELKRLLNVIPNTREGLRERAWLLCLIDSINRVTAVCNARLDDYDPETGGLNLRDTKTGDTTVTLTTKAREALNEWLAVREPTTYLFETRTGNAPHRSYGNKLLKRLSERAGLDWVVNPHSLKHAGCRVLKEAGIPWDATHNWIGNESEKVFQEKYGNRPPDQTTDEILAVLERRLEDEDEPIGEESEVDRLRRENEELRALVGGGPKRSKWDDPGYR
jgi:integrase